MLKPLLLLTALLLAVSPALGAATYNDGLRLMKAERYREAIPIFEREARLNPGSADVLMNLGWAYWHVHAYNQSWKVWDLLAKLDPRNPTYIRLLAELEIERKNYDKALALTDRALAVSPGDRDTLLVKARTLERLDRDPEAAKILDDLLARYPDYPPVLYANADRLAARGKLGAALELFDQLVHMQPKAVPYRRGRAAVLYRLGHYEEALAEWKALADADPPDEKSMINLGWAAWADKHYDEAMKYGQKLLDLYPENPTYLRFVASLDLELSDPGAALELADRGLEVSPGDKDTRLIKAEALFQLDRDQEAIKLLQQLLDEYPDEAKLKFHMADFLADIGRGDEALKYFDELIEQYPENFVYRKMRAQTLYETGHFDKAVAEWKWMTEKYPLDPTAFEALLDDAINRKDWPDSLHWMRELAGAKPLSAMDWYRLADIYFQQNMLPQAIAAADKSYQTDHTLLGALFFKGDLLERAQRYDEAKAVWEQGLAANPNSIRALFSLSRIYEAKGDLKRAAKILDTIRAKFFSKKLAPPYLVMYEARLVADDGHVVKAYHMLRRLDHRDVRAIPVILYHGIAKTARADVISQQLFDRQMKALKDHGYDAITLSQLVDFFHGHGRLPPKPILITFDDGRIDAFRNGDAILKKYGLKATMFVIFSGKRTRFHANIGELRQYAATGRWEMQTHAGRSHVLIPIDDKGHRGHFLANRMWLAKEHRLETDQEMEARLDADYKWAKEHLIEYFPKTKHFGFAFPFGDYGEAEYSNTEQAPAINQRMMEKYFDLAFVQDQYGFNIASSKRWELSRWEIPKDLPARKVIEHLQLDEPWVRLRTLEAQMWLRTGQPRRAVPLFDSVYDRGVHQPELVAERGVAYERAGNSWMGRQAYRQASKEEPANVYYRNLRIQNEANRQPTLQTDGSRMRDSAGRENTTALIKARADAGPTEVAGWLGMGRYRETNFAPVDAHSGGASLGVFVLPKLKVEGQVEHRIFDAQTRTTRDNYQGDLSLLAVRGMKVTAGAGRANVETASGIEQGLAYRNYFGQLDYDVAMNWTLSGLYDRLLYTDANRQWDGRAQLMRKVARYFTAGYGLWLGDSTQRVPNYWTPRRLQEHMGIVSALVPFGDTYETTGAPRFEVRGQFGYGWGRDNGTSRSVQDARATFAWRPADTLTLHIDGELSFSPVYTSRELSAGISLSY